MSGAVPWRLLGLFYAFYFGLMGLMMPYWPLYLAHLGLAPAPLSWVLMVAAISRLWAPNVWAWWADRRAAHLKSVRYAAVGLAVSSSAWLVAGHLTALLAAMLVFSFFQNALLAQFEVVALRSLGRWHHRYGHVRLYGSLAFVLVSMLCGIALAKHMQALPVVVLCFCMGMAGLAYFIPDLAADGGAAQSRTGIRFDRALGVFLGVNFLNQAAHGAYYTFYSVYLQEAGYSTGFIGFAWGWAVAAETLLFACLPKHLLRWSEYRVLLICLMLSVLRWLMIAYGRDHVAILLAAQTLHAASFAGFHLAGIAYIHRRFGSTRQGTGQALFSATGFGLGGGLGAAWAGQVWGYGAQLSFSLAALISVMAVLLWWRCGGRDLHSQLS